MSQLTPRLSEELINRVEMCGVQVNKRRSAEILADVVRQLKEVEGLHEEEGVDDDDPLENKQNPKVITQPRVYKIKVEQCFKGLGGLDEPPHEVVSWVDPSETAFWCADGRCRNALLATPGGDACEFLLGLAVFSKSGGSIPSPQSVRTLLQKYVRTHVPVFRKFFFHTDIDAVTRLKKAVGIPNLDMRRPGDQKIQDRMLKYLIQPEYCGCHHFRYILENEKEYQIPRLLTQWFLGAFYHTMWNKDKKCKLMCAIYEGKHTEEAITNLHVNSKTAGLEAVQYAPLLRPMAGGVSQILNHPQHVSVLRVQIADFFCSKLNDVSVDEFVSRMNELAALQLYATVNRVVADKEGNISVFAVSMEI